jgi:hypothetical protein
MPFEMKEYEGFDPEVKPSKEKDKNKDSKKKDEPKKDKK